MDPVAVARWNARTCLASPWLHEEVGTHMVQRLQWMRVLPESWLDWSPVRGGVGAHWAMAAAYPSMRPHWPQSLAAAERAVLMAADPRPAGWWRRFRASVASRGAEVLPEVDMIWANMHLHAVEQPEALMRQWLAALRVDGFLMFSCLGPDSLKELRSLYQQMGWSPPGHGFVDMHDLGDMLAHAGFAEPVMDMERITLTYASVDDLLRDLRTMGRNLHIQRDASTHGRGWLTHWKATLHEHLPRTADRRIPLSFEVLYGHAYKAKPRNLAKSSTEVPLDDMRRMLRNRRS
jgi:malonyl-CoA O-methyltransferase